MPEFSYLTAYTYSKFEDTKRKFTLLASSFLTTTGHLLMINSQEEFELLHLEMSSLGYPF